MSKANALTALGAAIAFGGLLAAAAPAAAAPMLDPLAPAALASGSAQPEAVRWVCNAWGRCWWRPGRAYYRYYRPRRHYHHRHYRRW